MIRLLALGLMVAAAISADSAPFHLRYMIPQTRVPKLTPRQRAQILEAICQGTSDGTRCDTCPADAPRGSGFFSLELVVFGHFLSPTSHDAMVTIAGCEEMHASVGWGFLLTRRHGHWAGLQDVLGLDLRHCHPMRFRSGRELLICEDYRMESFILMHSVTAVFAKGKRIAFRNLATASDTTRLCDAQNLVQKAEIDQVEFGNEGISFMVSRGEMRDSERRQQLCQAAQDRKPATAGPGPRVMRFYRIDYAFDGQRFELAKESEAAAKLFRPLE